MKILLAAVTLLLAVIVAPAGGYAGHLQKPFERIVRWAGCNADLVTSDAVSPVRSFYASGPDLSLLGVGTGGWAPAYAILGALLHEIGHCLQRQEGARFASGREAELDADRREAELACALGLDGPRLLREELEWTRDTYDYHGDPSHGTLVERISQGDGACAVQRVPLQT